MLGGRLSQIAGDVIDRKLTGYVDEVRIWKSARVQSQINLDRSNRLSGTELGLVFYLHDIEQDTYLYVLFKYLFRLCRYKSLNSHII